jgi:hypothetical protein
VGSAAETLLRRGVSAQHEHGLPAFSVQLLEEQERLLLEAETSLLVAVHDVEGVLSPVVRDVVSFESLSSALALF